MSGEELVSKPKFDGEKEVRFGPCEATEVHAENLHRLREAFDRADPDGSGNIDVGEFCNLIKSLCEEDHMKPPADKDLAEAFAQADADGSGQVDIGEFKALYQKVKRGEVKGLGGGMFNFGGNKGHKKKGEKVEDGKKDSDDPDGGGTGSGPGSSSDLAKAVRDTMTPEQKAQLEELGIGQGTMVEMDRSQPLKSFNEDFAEADEEDEGQEEMKEGEEGKGNEGDEEQKDDDGEDGEDDGDDISHKELSPEDIQRVKAAFEHADEDNSGCIDVDEFKVLIKKLCEEDGEVAPQDKDMDQVFKDADEDGGGAVDLGEFTNLYAKVKRGEVKGMGGHLVTFKPLLSDMPRAKDWNRKMQKSFKAAVARKLEVPDNLVKLTFTRLVYGVLTPDDMNRVSAAFERADVDGGGGIDMKEFTELMHKLTQEDGQPCPSDKDLRTAFDDADEDGGGAVDLDEFTKLYAKVKKGQVKGLGGGMFSFRKKDANPYAGRKSLFVRVACAEDLIRADVFGGSDPYAKVYWNNLYAGKTPVINDTLNPVWERDSSVFEIPIDTSNDEEFELGIPDDSKLKIELFDHDTLGSHDSLGELKVDAHEIHALVEKSRIGLEKAREDRRLERRRERKLQKLLRRQTALKDEHMQKLLEQMKPVEEEQEGKEDGGEEEENGEEEEGEGIGKEPEGSRPTSAASGDDGDGSVKLPDAADDAGAAGEDGEEKEEGDVEKRSDEAKGGEDGGEVGLIPPPPSDGNTEAPPPSPEKTTMLKSLPNTAAGGGRAADNAADGATVSTADDEASADVPADSAVDRAFDATADDAANTAADAAAVVHDGGVTEGGAEVVANDVEAKVAESAADDAATGGEVGAGGDGVAEVGAGAATDDGEGKLAEGAADDAAVGDSEASDGDAEASEPQAEGGAKGKGKGEGEGEGGEDAGAETLEDLGPVAKGKRVKWTKSDDDIPEGALGTVSKMIEKKGRAAVAFEIEGEKKTFKLKIEELTVVPEGGAPPGSVADTTPRTGGGGDGAQAEQTELSELDQMEADADLENDTRPSATKNRYLAANGDGSNEAGIFEFKAKAIAEIDSDEEGGADSRPESEEADSRPDTGASSRGSSRASTAASENNDNGNRGKAKGKGKWKMAKSKLKAADALSKKTGAKKGEGKDGQQNGDLTVVDIEDGEKAEDDGEGPAEGEDEEDEVPELTLDDISSDEEEEGDHESVHSLASELDHDDAAIEKMMEGGESTFGFLSFETFFGMCCARKKKGVVDLSKGLGQFGKKVMASEHMEIVDYKAWYPLHIGEETSGAKIVKGTMSLRFIYSENGTILRGLDEGVRHMSLGEMAKIRVRRDYAYADVFGTSKIAPESDLLFEVKLTHLNGRGALYHRMKRGCLKCGYGFLSLFVNFEKVWEKATGCPCPMICCPCCYADIPDFKKKRPEEEALIGDESYESSDDEEPEIVKKFSMMDMDDEETESERLRRIAFEKQGAHALFGKGTKLQEEELKADYDERDIDPNARLHDVPEKERRTSLAKVKGWDPPAPPGSTVMERD
mmetsp:Transcript_24718/g.66649  ORF Transcript_24718/g.66649 Transcript_24718/m.66649 type:complete len:1536 (-) Transcript_24718:79-4686(-)